MERALLARIDLIGFDRHLRMDVPVPVSILALVARAGRLIPALRVGGALSRRRRKAIEKALEEAIETVSDPDRYREWVVRLREWESLAIDGRLQDAPVSLFE